MKTKLLNKLVKFFYVITFQLKNIAQPTLFRLGNWQIPRLQDDTGTTWKRNKISPLNLMWLFLTNEKKTYETYENCMKPSTRHNKLLERKSLFLFTVFFLCHLLDNTELCLHISTITDI